MIERAEGVPVLRAGGSAIDSDSDRLRLVYAVQRILAAADDQAALISGAAALLAEYRSYKLIALYVAEPDGSLAPIAGDGSLREDAGRWKIRARWDDSPLGRGTMGSAIRSGVPVVRTPEDWVDPEWRAAALPHGVRKSAAFPFTLGESMAVLYALTDDPQGFAPPELELLQSLAEDIGRSLDNLRMRSALVAERARAERRLARLEALWELANEPNEIDAQAQAIVSEGARRLEMEWGAIGHVEGKAICVDFVTADDPVKLAGKRIAVDDSVTGSAVAERRTVAHGNILDDPQLSHFQTARDYGTRAVIATPFTSGEREHVLFFGARSLREQPFDEEDFSYIELLAAFFSKTLQQRDDEARIVFLQQHDPLTLLPTRPRMQARLDELLARAGGGLALLLIDVNAFGKINAEHGYETGDQMLVEIAHRLILELAPAYELYRISGDAFGVVVPLNDVKVNDTLARRLVTVLAEPMRHHGRDIPMSVCIGMAVAPEDGRSSTELEINAEAALRRAKTEGVSGPRYYSTAVDHALTYRRVLESELRAALAARELVLFYQPVVDLRSEAVIGLEALVRWPHATRGLIPPAEFIPIAEESDAIIALGIAVMELAAAQTPHFLSSGKRIPVAINLSAAQFQDPRLLDDLKSMVATCGPGCFEIELTESVAMHDSSAVLATLSACKDLGLRVALDDFGTGHSSLTLLRRLPIDIVKIDRSFISGIPDDVEDAAIARAVVALARSLGCEVRAEGVETPTQAAWLRTEGCDSAQGYLYAKPLPLHELAAWMELRHTASK